MNSMEKDNNEGAEMHSAAHGTKPRLMSRALVLVFTASFGAMMSFYLLLSVVPRYATTIGASGIGAGFMTGALMGATVVTELAVPSLVARFGYRLILAAGLLLLGAPAFALSAAASLTAVAAICIIRGTGLAIIAVAGSALVAALAPPSRRGEGLGVYGLVVGVPSIVALPLGLWLSERAGYPIVFVLAAIAALAGLAVLPGVPPQPVQAQNGTLPARGMVAALRTPAILRPALMFSATAMAAGAVVTFLPLAVPSASGTLAAFALLAQAAAATGARWWAGHHGDRHGSGRLLVPAVLVAAVGLSVLTLVAHTAAVVLGMIVLGLGFGVAQNASLALMFEQVTPAEYDAASAVWNIAYDAGLGFGGVGFGFLAARTGYPAAFGMAGGLMLTALLAFWQDGKWLHPAKAAALDA